MFGQPVPEALPRVLAQVGALIETPRLFPQWGGRYNLQVLATIAGLPQARVEECLELVGMREHADAPFKSCSLGMKQRLGIGAALLKNPRLLILDEPGNGLDPAGIREMRDLIKRLGAGNETTVFVSSHQLGEIEQMCDRVSILSRGRLIAAGEVPEMMNRSGVPDVLVRVDDLEITRQIVAAAGFECVLQPDGLLVHAVGDPAFLSQILAARGQFVSALIPQATSLESSFLELTGETPTVGISR
jgi:ABC-2 type transport system ATP-binding protein